CAKIFFMQRVRECHLSDLIFQYKDEMTTKNCQMSELRRVHFKAIFGHFLFHERCDIQIFAAASAPDISLQTTLASLRDKVNFHIISFFKISKIKNHSESSLLIASHLRQIDFTAAFWKLIIHFGIN